MKTAECLGLVPSGLQCPLEILSLEEAGRAALLQETVQGSMVLVLPEEIMFVSLEDELMSIYLEEMWGSSNRL